MKYITTKILFSADNFMVLAVDQEPGKTGDVDVVVAAVRKGDSPRYVLSITDDGRHLRIDAVEAKVETHNVFRTYDD